MATDTQTQSLFSIAKDIRSTLPASVQDKYSTRDIHRTLAYLLIKSGDLEKNDTALEPTASGIDHGIIIQDDDSSLKFLPAAANYVCSIFYKAYPAFSPAVLSDSVLEGFKETGKVEPSFEYQGKTYKYTDQAWYEDSNLLSRDKTLWAEKQFSALFFNNNLGVSMLADIGDQFRSQGPKRLGALFYDEALKKAEPDKKKKLLTKLAGTYRQLHMPLRAIKLYEDMSSDEYALCVSVPFLTAVASAYCDINNNIAAKELADKATELGNGKQGIELSSLYRRIRSGNGTGK
ncbi:MAG: hypothetical protein Q4F31_08725 [Eubacteriales bacterium]|nr:hypothetical protein [Eubacteriales bacterium]